MPAIEMPSPDQGSERRESNLLHLASELVIDAVVRPGDLRGELVRRYAVYASRERSWPPKHNPITPV